VHREFFPDVTYGGYDVAGMSTFDVIGERVALRKLTGADRDGFVGLMLASRDFHYPWVDPPKTPAAFDEFLRVRQKPDMDGFVICLKETGTIAGYVNINCIVRASFESAFLGYAIGAPFAGKGLMTEAMKLVTRYAFAELKLHRLEANIQPGNAASIALVRRCGFRLEGFSPRYLRIFGEWRDHERWALLADELGDSTK
jgi:ribosomal-protein-alanine N-acetyltransferase